MSNFDIQNISVCMQIYMSLGENDNETDLFSREWTMGSCYGPKLGKSYLPNEIWYDRCCLPEGQYVLTCTNTRSVYGWGNATFKINEKQYCDDFVGFTAMRKISVKGKIHSLIFRR